MTRLTNYFTIFFLSTIALLNNYAFSEEVGETTIIYSECSHLNKTQLTAIFEPTGIENIASYDNNIVQTRFENNTENKSELEIITDLFSKVDLAESKRPFYQVQLDTSKHLYGSFYEWVFEPAPGMRLFTENGDNPIDVDLFPRALLNCEFASENKAHFTCKTVSEENAPAYQPFVFKNLVIEFSMLEDGSCGDTKTRFSVAYGLDLDQDQYDKIMNKVEEYTPKKLLNIFLKSDSLHDILEPYLIGLVKTIQDQA